jgi:hypothetical protein
MTTQTFDWSGSQSRIASGLLAQARALEVLGIRATRAALALVPAMGIQVGASWAISTPGMLEYFQAMLWSSGYVCFASAIESESAKSMAFRLVTGLAVQLLTGLSASLAPEWAFVASAVLAVCSAVAIFRRT